MNLKKSDKMIDVAAVVVLIIAAIGIIFYTETDDGDGKKLEWGKEKYYTYGTIYEIKEASATPDNTNYVVKDKMLGADEVYKGVVEISGRHVKQITFEVNYNDNHKGFLGGRLLKNLGADTLTVTVSGSNMEEQKKTISGSGNVTLSSDENSCLELASIEAKDDFEAREKLNENLSLESMTMMETYTITVSVKTGEKVIFRPIKWLLEKLGKDTFKMDITYEYYEYSLDIPEELPLEDTPEGDLEETSWRATPYNTMSRVGGFF